jgi:hypothetical protein
MAASQQERTTRARGANRSGLPATAARLEEQISEKISRRILSGDRIEGDVVLLQEVMRRASRIVLNATVEGTHELRTDANTIRYPARYADKRGDAIWDHVIDLLTKQGQQAKRRA